jgi:Ras-related protein Rab-1A
MSTDQFNSLLSNLVNALDGIKAAAIVDKDGLIIASQLRDKTGDEDVIGSVTAMFDTFISRIKSDFGSAEDFLNIITVDQNKIVFAAAGPNGILTIIAEPDAPDNALKAYAIHIAKKVKLCLDGEMVDITIPQIVALLADMRSGKLPEGEFNAKIIVMGDPSVGKTSLIHRFVDDSFSENYIATIGVDISKKGVSLGPNSKITFILWDISGQIKNMASYRARFYGGANFALLVCDISNRNSFLHLDDWIADLKKAIDKSIPMIILVNKSDLTDQAITPEMIQQKADQLHCPFLLTSAKTGTNVYDAFLYCAYKFLQNA